MLSTCFTAMVWPALLAVVVWIVAMIVAFEVFNWALNACCKIWKVKDPDELPPKVQLTVIILLVFAIVAEIAIGVIIVRSRVGLGAAMIFLCTTILAVMALWWAS